MNGIVMNLALKYLADESAHHNDKHLTVLTY